MKKVVMYNHHARGVCVFKKMLGKHKAYCLCYKCERFLPNTGDNCTIAETVHQMNIKFNLVTPVWECPYFIMKNKL